MKTGLSRQGANQVQGGGTTATHWAGRRAGGGGAGRESGGGGGGGTLNLLQRQSRVDSCVNFLNLGILHTPHLDTQERVWDNVILLACSINLSNKNLMHCNSN